MSQGLVEHHLHVWKGLWNRSQARVWAEERTGHGDPEDDGGRGPVQGIEYCTAPYNVLYCTVQAQDQVVEAEAGRGPVPQEDKHLRHRSGLRQCVRHLPRHFLRSRKLYLVLFSSLTVSSSG